MYDGLQVYFRSREAHDQLLKEIQGLVFSGHNDNGAVSDYHGYSRHVFIKIFETNPPGIRLNGSLHRYAQKNNSGRFCLADINNAVADFSSQFHIPPEEHKIQKLELGVNIPTKCPEAIIRSAMLFYNRTGRRDSKKGYISKTWKFNEYTVKLYKKGPHLLRYEIHIDEMRKIKDLDLRSLNNLCKYDHFVPALFFLIKNVDKFTFVPSDKENRIEGKNKEKWNSFRAESFWEEIDKDKRYHGRKTVKTFIKEYQLIDWVRYIKHKTILEGCLMLKISLPALRAKFSALGLQEETVADPIGESDRQADTKNIKKTILVPVHHVVRNTGCMVDVYISTRSYQPLLARGPPSVFVFRWLMYLYNVALLMPVVSRMSLIWMVPVS